MIFNLFKSKPLIKLFILSILLNIIFISLIDIFFKNEIIVTDPRFEKRAYNILHHNSAKIIWGDNIIMLNPYEIQKGEYNNWYPIGYSLILLGPLMTGDYYLLSRTILQIFLFSFIPVLIFNIAKNFFGLHKDALKLSLLTSIIVSMYPIYLNFSLQGSDTGMITLINAMCLYLFYRSIKSCTKKDFVLLGIALSILFLFRPIGLVPYFILLFVEFYQAYRNKKTLINVLLPMTITLFAITGWGIRNFVVSSEFNITQSNVGYNFWLGNNEFTNSVLKNRIGDGASIEDDIIPYFDHQWSFLKNKDEYEKDSFFISKAFEFVINNPLETVENVFWKFAGY